MSLDGRLDRLEEAAYFTDLDRALARYEPAVQAEVTGLVRRYGRRWLEGAITEYARRTGQTAAAVRAELEAEAAAEGSHHGAA